MKLNLLKYSALSIFIVLAASPAKGDIFSYTGTIVDWTVPTTGDYVITAIGAQGGEGTYCCGFVGGLGAEIEGTFLLIGGSELQIAVGGQGQSSYGNGGGGGGSFVVDSLNNPLVIAGGGGGIRADAGQNGTNASITEAAYNGSCASLTYTPSPTATIGLGGSAPCASWGSAGGGFNSNGQSDPDAGYGGTGGQSWFNGLAGGVGSAYCYPADGGFGGGGAGNGCYGGGGGGGYSGGDGGLVAGGGGSYNAGADPFAEAGVGSGNGSVEIDAVASPVPEPFSLLLFGTATVGLVSRLRRKARQ